MGSLPIIYYLFLQWVILIGPSPKKRDENWQAPQNKRFLCEDGECCLWLNYIGEKGRTLGKGYGIK